MEWMNSNLKEIEPTNISNQEQKEKIAKEIAQKVSKTARAVQRALNRLKEDGKIVRIGNKVSGYWEVM